ALLQDIRAQEGPSALGRFRVGSYVIQAPPEPHLSGDTLTDFRAAFQAEGLRSPITGLWDLESQECYLPAATERWSLLYPHQDARLLNTRYLVLSPSTVKPLHWPQGSTVSWVQALGLVLVRTPHFVERVYLAHPTCVPDARAAVAHIHHLEFRPGVDAA